MKFNKGDELIFINKLFHYSAEAGARAICQGYSRDNRFITIKWIRDKKDHEQVDGGYYEDDFILAKSKEPKLYGIAIWCKENYEKVKV